MRHLVLTLDYELYGDGSGNVFRDVIKPTESLLSIARQYGVRYTFFFEVVEYWRLKGEWEKGNRMGYDMNPIEAMENQLRQAYSEGHDVQLHVHPQWVKAVYEQNRWIVNVADWRLGNYEGLGEDSLVNLLRRGRETLENLLKPIDANYKCTILRAGGYNVQPSTSIHSAMMEVGLQADTSVFPGGKNVGGRSYYDYGSVPVDIGWWHTSERLENVGVSSILEIPIVAFPVRRIYRYFSLSRLFSLMHNTGSAKSAYRTKTSESKRKIDKFFYLFGKEFQNWDVCLFSKAMHRRYLRLIERQTSRDVFVLIGHPKSLSSLSGLVYLIQRVAGCYAFDTMSFILEKCLQKDYVEK